MKINLKERIRNYSAGLVAGVALFTSGCETGIGPIIDGKPPCYFWDQQTIDRAVLTFIHAKAAGFTRDEYLERYNLCPTSNDIDGSGQRDCLECYYHIADLAGMP